METARTHEKIEDYVKSWLYSLLIHKRQSIWTYDCCTIVSTTNGSRFVLYPTSPLRAPSTRGDR